tara:strand:- start:30 stop:281 length:252 start_codon:yes stop_codon:yes gene_type:complete
MRALRFNGFIMSSTITIAIDAGSVAEVQEALDGIDWAYKPKAVTHPMLGTPGLQWSRLHYDRIDGRRGAMKQREIVMEKIAGR